VNVQRYVALNTRDSSRGGRLVSPVYIRVSPAISVPTLATNRVRRRPIFSALPWAGASRHTAVPRLRRKIGFPMMYSSGNN
jgi:hypothetical protein